MRVLLWIAAAIAMSLLATDSPTIAHHASAAFYDGNQSVEIQGSVTRFVFRNPHSFLYVDATDENGRTIGWEIEMGASVMMSRRGWTPDTISAGDEIKAVGQPSRAPGTYGMCCAELTRPDGSPLRP